MIHRVEPRSPAPERWARWGVVCLLGLFAFWVVPKFLVQGLVFPVRIHGGSMAPNLIGKHFLYRCERCGCPSPIGQIPVEGVVCPNCGELASHDGIQSSVSDIDGQRVLLDRLTFRGRSPRRWEVVAFRRDDGQKTVKRIVGLPGEKVAVRNGDVWINDQRTVKPFDVLQSMLIPIYSEHYRGVQDVPPRFTFDVSTESNSVWVATSGGYRFRPACDELVFLRYEHRACLPPPIENIVRPRVWDSYGFNQDISRGLETVTDVLVESHVSWVGSNVSKAPAGRLAIELAVGNTTATLYWDAEDLVVFIAGEQVRSLPLPMPTSGNVSIVTGFADGQILFAIDGVVRLRQAVDFSRHSDPELVRESSLFAIAGSNLQLDVHELRVARDVHYLRVPGGDAEWQLEESQFLVLGDNCPVSLDARQEPEYGIVTPDQFIGRVVP